MQEKEEKTIKKYARACVYEKIFVSLQPLYNMRLQGIAMDELIRHEGIVLRTEGEKAHVAIVQTSACSACKARSMCMSSESREKEIDAVMTEPMQPGDRVEVEVRERLAWKAVLLAYILPFVVMTGIIVALDLLTEWPEAVTGTLALCGIALYYIGLSFFRNRLQKQFSFTARKL